MRQDRWMARLGNCWVECSQASFWNVLHEGRWKQANVGKLLFFSRLEPDASHQIMLWKNCFCYNIAPDTSDLR